MWAEMKNRQVLIIVAFNFQVQNLVMSHEDLFHTILNDTGEIHSVTESHSMTSLKQLSLAIAIVSLLPITDKRDDAWEVLTEEQRSWRTFMNRIHRLMLSLLNKYSIASCKKVRSPFTLSFLLNS